MDHLDEAWASEAERLHRRYLVEIVEAFGLCPWAERARRDGRTRVRVLLDSSDTAIAASIAAVDGWVADDRVEIGFVVFPRLALGRLEFERFVARVRELDAGGHELGRIPFVLAAFHPEGEPDLGDPARLVPFLRRTPDPCIQAVRTATLERLRAGTKEGTQFVDVEMLDASVGQSSAPPLGDRIAQANLETVRRTGLERFAACIGAIQRDRALTYAALAERSKPLAVADGEPPARIRPVGSKSKPLAVADGEPPARIRPVGSKSKPLAVADGEPPARIRPVGSK